MPNPTNGVRGGSSKRSDHKKNQEPGSFDSQSSSRRNIEEPRSPIDVLAHSSEALQRLASLALYFGSFTHDMQTAEDDYGAEIAKENTIRELKETVESLARVKSEKTEKLQQDYERLLNEQEEFQQKKKEYLEIQEKLAAQNAAAEVNRRKESEQNLLEEKTKFEKTMKAKKAELEEEYSRKLRDLNEKCVKLSAANAKLEQRCSEAKQTMRIMEKRHTRDQETLENKNEKLDEALKQWQAQFPVEGKPIEF